MKSRVAGVQSLCVLAVALLVAPGQAHADFGPDLGYLVTLTVGFVLVAVLGPLLAPPGWRFIALAAVVAGYPFSIGVLGQLVRWTGPGFELEYYENFRLTMWLTLVTWAYLPLGMMWLRSHAARGSPVTPETSGQRAADWLVALTVASLVLMPSAGRALPIVDPMFRMAEENIPALRHWLPPAMGLLVVMVPVAAAIGVWFRSKLAWMAALAASAIGLASWVQAILSAGQSRESSVFSGLPIAWLWNGTVAGAMLAIVLLILLLFPLRRWIWRDAAVEQPNGTRETT